MRVLMVHGRAQGGRDPKVMEQEWRDALAEGLALAGTSFPDGTKLDFPFYGDELDKQVIRLSKPHKATGMMGAGTQNEADRLLATALEEIAATEGLPPETIREEMDGDVGEMGPQNWEWVQAIVRVIDRRFPGVSGFSIEVFLRDVFLYLTSRQMRRAINKIVEDKLTDEPTVIVSHSLGTVVCYNILKDRTDVNLKGFVTLGSPLAIRAVSGKLGRPDYVAGDETWYNAFDERDIVSLNPLDEKNFPTAPAITNNNQLLNDTGNNHGISGYLDDAIVAVKIVDMCRRV